MSCAEYRRLISGYLDETLSLRQHDALLEHLERCESCAATLARYRQMDLLLRRLPSSAPSPAVRRRVLSAPPLAQRARLPRSLPAMAATFALPLLVMALLSAGNGLWRAGGALVAATPVVVLGQRAAPDDAARPPFGTTALPVRSPSGPGEAAVAAPDDAAVLQQVRRTVRNDRFQPLQPAYLPSGARLDTVNFGREQPAGPIDRLDVAFAADGQRIRLRQLSGTGTTLEQQLQAQPRWQPPKRIVVAGREWLYLRRPGDRGTEAVGILIGQRDGLVIWLESSLPVEELEKVAASLQD